MRMVTSVLMVALGALVGTARPAAAGDGEAARIAQLQADCARLTTEMTHLREAYGALEQNAQVAVRTVTTLTNSLNASRELIAALTTERNGLRAELEELRRDLAERPADDPVRLRVKLRDEQKRHATDVTLLQASLVECQEVANRHAVRLTNAEMELASSRQEHAQSVAALEARLAEAEATIKRLREGR